MLKSLFLTNRRFVQKFFSQGPLFEHKNAYKPQKSKVLHIRKTPCFVIMLMFRAPLSDDVILLIRDLKLLFRYSFYRIIDPFLT